MFRLTPLFVAGLLACATLPVVAQDAHEHAPGEPDHHEGLHFSHPIFTESISPDTKVRLDFARAWSDGENESEVEAEAEYAFHESFSVEVVAPYVILHPSGADAVSRFGSVEVALKFANFAFADHGVLLGYGIEVGLPTGNQAVGIGSDHLWELGPVLSLGL